MTRKIQQTGAGAASGLLMVLPVSSTVPNPSLVCPPAEPRLARGMRMPDRFQDRDTHTQGQKAVKFLPGNWLFSKSREGFITAHENGLF